MLSKQYRLILPYSYRFLPKKSKRVKTKSFSLLVIPRLRESGNKEVFSRFACTVSKKLEKRATRRNKTRRLIIESIRQLLPKVRPGFDVIISARKIFWQEKLNDVLPEVKQLFKKACLLRANGQ